MSTDPGFGKKLSSLLRSIRKVDPPADPDSDDPLDHLVFAFLLWESSMTAAVRAYRKLMKSFVDLNDLRVTMPDELASIIGTTYPCIDDRTLRLRACLRSIYLREHRMSLDAVAERPKREIRTYLETLDGMTPFVVERVMLMGFGAHGVPVDEKLRGALVRAEALDGAMALQDACTWMTRQIKADQAEVAHHKLQSWADKGAGAAGRSRTRSTTARKPTKKTTSKTRKKSGTTTRKRASTR